MANLNLSKTVLYYNRGQKCCLRMLVSIYSLRKHWDGSVTVLLEGEQDPWFVAKLEELHCTTRNIPYSGEYPLSIKPKLHRYVEDYDLVMFLDADTLVVGAIDEYFQMIVRHQFVTGNFANWKTSGSSISRRIKKWEPAVPELIKPALDYGTAINTGINGWISGTPQLKEWDRVCQLGYKKRCTNRIVDEIACQLILPHVEHRLAGVEWGTSVKFGKVTKETKIIHYHGHKHVGNYRNCGFWKNTYKEMVKDGFIDKEHECFYDSSVKKWLKEGETKMACTLVTAVNKAYIEKFKKNYPQWIKIPELAVLQQVIFVHEDCWHDMFWEKEFVNRNEVKLVKWSFPVAETMREEMLSAFVFGVAEHVKTRHWIKLDCDCTPKSDKLNIPDEAWNATLCAKAWGYTKCKKDPQFDRDGIHWLKKLDAWADTLPDFDGTKPLFEDVEIKGSKHNHKRICTFFAVEKTKWTQHLAKMCGKRLPVPSQDTLTWYGITRLGGKRTIYKYDFRKYWRP